MGLAISIAAEPVLHIGNIAITNSLLSTFFVLLFFVSITFAFSSKTITSFPKGKSLQNILEIICETLLSFYASIVGDKKAKAFFPFLTTLFLFILISSWSGLLPGVGSVGIKEFHNGEEILVPFFRAPTADLNTTIALAILGVAFTQYQGLRHLSIHYLKKFFNFSNPMFTFVGLLELISEFVKIISFAFRLFGNIFAGEVLLAVMSFLLPIVAPLPFLGLEIFVGLIQSLVFVMLVLVFTGGATEAHH
ncbi:F0F1 ATP synthase subunit A [Candidatus Beckwithbacteria bacterium]|nr:F0F1 ATP synthase subunit A [Candidatus Beckwithbacteria bacterium]